MLKTSNSTCCPRPASVRIGYPTERFVGCATPDYLFKQALTDNIELAPDLVVLTGDYVNRGRRQLPELKRLVSRLPRPCIAVLGNHDHWAGADMVQCALEEAGVIVLRDQHVVLSLPGMRLTVVGIDHRTDDPDEIQKIFAPLPDKRNLLVLVHSPKDVDLIARYGGRLILAGHTHGGQIDVPRITQPIMRMLGHRFIAGWYSAGPALLYVNAGIGSAVMRTRRGHRAAPEVALIELTGES